MLYDDEHDYIFAGPLCSAFPPPPRGNGACLELRVYEERKQQCRCRRHYCFLAARMISLGPRAARRTLFYRQLRASRLLRAYARHDSR